MLADRIFACEILLNELTTHNHLVRALNTFVAGKEPSAHKRDSERAEIAWIGPARQRVGQVFARLERRMLLHREFVGTPVSCSRNRGSQCSAANSGHSSHSRQQRFVECVSLLRRVVLLAGQVVLQSERVVYYALDIGCAQLPKTF